MNKTEYYYEQLKKNRNVHNDHSDIDILYEIDEVLPLFGRELNFMEYSNLNAIVVQRYLVCESAVSLYDINLSTQNISKEISYLNIFGAKDEILDLSQYTRLERVDISGTKHVKKIVLPKSGALKALSILKLPNLEQIDNILLQRDLRYFHHRYSSKLKNFNFLTAFKKLVFLTIEKDNRLEDTNFLGECSAYFLDLSHSNVIKKIKLIDDLKNMSNLKVFADRGNTKKNRNLFKENLPHVCMKE